MKHWAYFEIQSSVSSCICRFERHHINLDQNTMKVWGDITSFCLNIDFLGYYQFDILCTLSFFWAGTYIGTQPTLYSLSSALTFGGGIP